MHAMSCLEQIRAGTLGRVVYGASQRDVSVSLYVNPCSGCSFCVILVIVIGCAAPAGAMAVRLPRLHDGCSAGLAVPSFVCGPLTAPCLFLTPHCRGDGAGYSLSPEITPSRHDAGDDGRDKIILERVGPTRNTHR